MNLFLTASYRLFPSLKEVRECKSAPVQGEGDIVTQAQEHDVWNSPTIAVLIDGAWKVVREDEFGAIVDGETDCAFAYVADNSWLVVGVNHRTSPNQRLDYDFLSEEWSYLESGELLIEAANRMSGGCQSCLESFTSVLYRLEWHKSVDWETGIDEGNFEIKESIWEL